MSIEECRSIWTASSKLPDFLVTKRSICFGGGPDGTISLCRVSSHTGSLLLIYQVTLKHDSFFILFLIKKRQSLNVSALLKRQKL